MRILKDILLIFFPNFCLNCNLHLLHNEFILCTICRHDVPLIQLEDYSKNEITSVFYGKVEIQYAASFLYYRKKGITKKLIHDLKYKNNEEIGLFIANWFGQILIQSEAFKNIDYIVPVPLHTSKLKKRGYNQLTTFGERLSELLDIKYNAAILERITATKTQTLKKRFDRFSNTNTKFNIIDTTFFTNKHILLIDDVITTGATLEACCNELQKTKNIKISIVTMAFTQKN